MFQSTTRFRTMILGFGVMALAGAGIPATAQTSAPAEALTFQAQAPIQSFSSSSSSSAADESSTAPGTQNLALVEKGLNLPGLNAQYGQRRRYGAPRYRGGNTNADGSSKYTAYIGGGFAIPSGSGFNYASTGWGLQAGVGRNLNRHVGVNLEFDYDHFGMGGNTLANQQNLYNYIINYYNQLNPSAGLSPVSGLDGTNHIWSFSLDPSYNFYNGEGLSAYVIGGPGFYHKVADFTVPAQGTYCDYYYGCYSYVANQTFDHYFSNSFGLNGGIGLTYKFSRFANERLYAEVRVVHTFNSPRAGITIDTVNQNNAFVPNDFPQNSNRTTWIPVKFGIRF